MGFIESYKHLEKLCGDMLQTQHGISAYIDDMGNTPNGCYWVKGWDEDLNRLKHYRWIRNQISHEPNCTEENMCEYGDAQWIDDFYDRIMNQSDPLAMYRKATRPQPAAKSAQNHEPAQLQYTYSKQPSQPKHKSKKVIRWIVFSIIVAIVLLYLVLKYFIN